jgi:mono/diheme cytochrome c family protein
VVEPDHGDQATTPVDKLPAPMLPSTLFIAFWAVLAVGLFFVAIRGGPGGARQALHVQSHRARNIWGVTLIVAYIGFGVVLPLVFLTGNHSKANAQVGGVKLTAAEKSGRQLFGQRCGICHTLSAANSIGKVGPNLDVLKPAESIVLHTINNGCLPNPPTGSAEACLGEGVMPADVVEGRAAQDVAAFVAKVAGNE